MTKQIIPLSFTDSDGDTFEVANIRQETHDSGDECLVFTVSMNDTDPVETLEWIHVDGFVERTDGNLEHHNFGFEATARIRQALDCWLHAAREVAA